MKSTRTTDTRIQILLIMLVAVISFGCVKHTKTERSAPLKQLAHSAEFLTETPLIDIGSGEARRHLIKGWSFNEGDRNNRSFVWSDGPESILDFFLAESRAINLELRCRPFRFPGSPKQTVDLILNDHSIAQITLKPGFSDSRVELPTRFLVAGVNTILFRYGYSRRVSEVRESSDHRELAVAWDRLQFFGLEKNPEKPRIEHDLSLSAGTGVGFFISNWNRLAIASVKSNQCDDCLIYVTLRKDQENEEVLTILSGATGTTEITIPQTDAPVRLGFRCTGTGSGSMTLVEPRLHGPELARTSHQLSSRGRRGAVTSGVFDPRSAESYSTVRRARRGEKTPLGMVHRRPQQIVGEKCGLDLPEAEAPPSLLNDRRPNILIYLVDTLRRDRLGCYGSKLGLSPRIDRIAEQGWVFEQAFAQSPWTKPSVASLFTGLSPVVHSVNGKDHRLPAAVQTIAEFLSNAGYQTAAFSTNAYVSPSQGFGQGFETFEYAPIRAHELNDLVAQWLNDNTNNKEPFLLYVHTVDPHAPYEPAPEYRRRFAATVDDPRTGSLEFSKALSRGEITLTTEVISDLMKLYNAEVAENDAAFGELVDVLEASQLLDDTLIVFLSDHGEEFYEHQALGHGSDLHDEVLSVPLVFHVPWASVPRRIGNPVQHIDLLPSLLEVAGVARPSHIEGRSLLSNIARPKDDERRIYSYLDLDGRRGMASTSARWKLVLPIAGMKTGRAQFFDRSSDSAELHDITNKRPVIAGYEASSVRAQLEDLQRDALTSESLILDEAQRRDLEALGYLH